MAFTSRVPSGQCWVTDSTGHIYSEPYKCQIDSRKKPPMGREGELRNDLIHVHYPYICQQFCTATDEDNRMVVETFGNYQSVLASEVR